MYGVKVLKKLGCPAGAVVFSAGVAGPIFASCPRTELGPVDAKDVFDAGSAFNSSIVSGHFRSAGLDVRDLTAISRCLCLYVIISLLFYDISQSPSLTILFLICSIHKHQRVNYCFVLITAL